MKIAFLTEYNNIGGGESNLLNLVENLMTTHDVTLYCSGKVLNEAVKRNIKVKKFKGSKRWLKFIPLISFNKSLIKELNKFDIVHAYSVNCVPLLYFVNSKKVWTTHGFWEKGNGLRGKVISNIINKTICVSTDVYNCTDIKGKEIIFLGTDFKIANKIVNQIFDVSNINLVCIGRFQEIKGQDILVKALKKLGEEKNDDQHVSLSFVGDVNGNNKKDIEFKKKVVNLVESIDSKNLTITFEGFQTDVRSYIEKSNMVVVPSRYESFSMVAIEALSCGKPLIAPNIAGPKDIVNSTEIGQLFEPGNSDSLKEKIAYSIENYSEFNQNKCIERASFFSIDNQAKNHLDLYKRVINE